MELNGPPERVCGVAASERGGRFSAGSPLNFTASESPFSHPTGALTRPLIRLETKAGLMEWGVAWKEKVLPV